MEVIEKETKVRSNKAGTESLKMLGYDEDM